MSPISNVLLQSIESPFLYHSVPFTEYNRTFHFSVFEFFFKLYVSQHCTYWPSEFWKCQCLSYWTGKCEFFHLTSFPFFTVKSHRCGVGLQEVTSNHCSVFVSGETNDGIRGELPWGYYFNPACGRGLPCCVLKTDAYLILEATWKSGIGLASNIACGVLKFSPKLSGCHTHHQVER
jgi:hypothetical protein